MFWINITLILGQKLSSIQKLTIVHFLVILLEGKEVSQGDAVQFNEATVKIQQGHTIFKLVFSSRWHM